MITKWESNRKQNLLIPFFHVCWPLSPPWSFENVGILHFILCYCCFRVYLSSSKFTSGNSSAWSFSWSRSPSAISFQFWFVFVLTTFKFAPQAYTTVCWRSALARVFLPSRLKVYHWGMFLFFLTSLLHPEGRSEHYSYFGASNTMWSQISFLVECFFHGYAWLW